VLGALYWAASQLTPPTLADGGYQGGGIGVLTPIKHPTDSHALDVDNRSYNALLRGLRCLGERAFALLVGRWRALRHITASPRDRPSCSRTHPIRTRTLELKVGVE
jgi:hypothetical protein